MGPKYQFGPKKVQILLASRPGNSVYFGNAVPSQKKFRSQKKQKEGNEKRRKREKRKERRKGVKRKERRKREKRKERRKKKPKRG